MPTKLTHTITPTYNYDSYISEVKYRLQHGYKLAKDRLTDRKKKNKNYYDKKINPLELQLNDRVNLLRHTKSHKFQRPYDPNCIVIEIISDAIVKIKKGRKTKQIHKDRLIKSNIDPG